MIRIKVRSQGAAVDVPLNPTIQGGSNWDASGFPQADAPDMRTNTRTLIPR